MEVSKTLNERFAQAAALGLAGCHEQALTAYEQLFVPAENTANTAEPSHITGEFVAIVELRKIHCLMALGRYEEARALCESGRMQLLAGELDIAGLYDYYFSHANILGHLGCIRQMDQKMTAAMRIATESLADAEKCENAWNCLLYWGKIHGQWQYLLQQAAKAHCFATRKGSYRLQQTAGEAAFLATLGLGNWESSKVAEKTSRRRRDFGIPEEIRDWELQLQSV